MSTSKHIDKICIAVVFTVLILSLLYTYMITAKGNFGAEQFKYESTLFDTSYVHKIDIVMDDWDDFIANCENEEYSPCSIVIDGNLNKNVALRAKGNTSLSNVKNLGSQRYSFKIEFDHYVASNTYHGLDKLCLNNLIQDNTMMKDYLVYRMMDDFGADAPLSSFAYITVNGEDWGLYLAVEAIEDSFMSRNYGPDAGELYKPDSQGFGGGRGNGKDFRMSEFEEGQFPGGTRPENITPENRNDSGNTAPENEGDTATQNFPRERNRLEGVPPGGGGPGGMSSDDLKLKYIDDDPSSYDNIFKSSKNDLNYSDKKRLIESLKNLSEYSELEDTLFTEEVLRYFVVHNFVCNGDSYTGSIIHNYYLHEKDGKLGMIPWDYNLAFGTFDGSSASDSVNTSIDSPITSKGPGGRQGFRGNGDDRTALGEAGDSTAVSGKALDGVSAATDTVDDRGFSRENEDSATGSGDTVDDRPMVGWIFSDQTYTDEYHRLFSEFIDRWFSDGQLESMIVKTAAMLKPYVEKDPTKFCTLDDFETGVQALKEYVAFRGEAVSRQLNGDNTPVDTGDLNINSMGSMGSMGDGNRGRGRNAPTTPPPSR